MSQLQVMGRRIVHNTNKQTHTEKGNTMKTVTLKTLLSVATLAVVASAVVLLTTHAAPNTPPSASVTVVNTDANPVPVVQQGGVTLNGTVPVRAVDSSTAQPVVRGGAATSSTGIGPVVDLYTVPAGKLLVVEHVSARLSVVPGVKVLFGDFRGQRGDLPFSTGEIVLLPVFTGTSEPRNPQKDIYLVSQPVKFYVAAGDHVIAGFSQDLFDTEASVFCSFTGYLVDVP